MIFNHLQKCPSEQPSAVQLQGLSNGNRQAPSHADEELECLEVEEIPYPSGGTFHDNDFIFVSDNVNCWVVRAADISVLEACGNYTRVYFNDSSALIRRPLRECECRLDPSTFFRTRRDCIVNLSRVKQMRMLDAKRFLFVLLDGKEIPMSRKQSLLFRKTKAL
jgi:two-component system, LytTR family, response regulator